MLQLGGEGWAGTVPLAGQKNPSAGTGRWTSVLEMRQKSLRGLCFVGAMFGDVSLIMKVFSLLGDTKSSSTVRSTLSDSWILPPLAISTSVEAKNTQTRSSKSLVFPVIDVSGLEYAAGAKFINVPSALQSISARAGAWPDSPNRQPSALPSIQSIFSAEEGKLLLLQAQEHLAST